MPPARGRPGGLLSGLLACGRVAFKVLGYFCIVVAVVLIGGVLFVYFRTVLPLIVPLRSAPGVLVFLPASWISFNLLFNYFMVCYTAPGTPDVAVSPEEAAALANETAPARGKGWSRWCKSCNKPKPPRAHHCHICDHCVLKMDHHCPWINQCVGHRNHRFFTLFLLYLWVACCWAVLTIAGNYFGLWQSPLADRNARRAAQGTLTFTFVICAAVWLVMFAFLGWNLYLILTNQTTIEFHFNRYQRSRAATKGEMFCNPYDVGPTRNLAQVFGPNRTLLHLFLPVTQPLPNDGATWLRIGDVHDTDDDD